MNTPPTSTGRPHARLAKVRRILEFGEPADWQKVLAFILVWAGAVVFALSRIDVSNVHPSRIWNRPEYSLRLGYTYSLILLFLPLLALGWWYRLSRKDDRDGSLKRLIHAVIRGSLLSALIFGLFDVLFATYLFDFPDSRAVTGLNFWGYTWADDCSTVWRAYRLTSCYARTIPVEEFIFYLGGAAVLRGMYIWASEDFLVLYTMKPAVYRQEARKITRLVSVNWTLVGLVAATLAVGFYSKRQYVQEGYPVYLILQVLIVSPPVVLLYNRVKRFINTRALLMVMVLQVLVSVIWEATAALPYGWWAYKPQGMIGQQVPPWSELPIEACAFWIGVGLSATFLHEATKIKVRTERSWRSVLLGGPTDVVTAADLDSDSQPALSAG